jgi:hypothetical protein
MQPAALNTLQEITIGSIYLMGGSFILGSLFTLLLLVLLDFFRAIKDNNKKPKA